MQDIITKICTHYLVAPTDIAKKKFRHLPQYTYEDILSRILSNNEESARNIFTEMNNSTTSSMLNKCFPGKVSQTQRWHTFLLALISMKRCSKCSNIKNIDSFYSNSNEPTGVHTNCIECSKEYYVTHKAQYKANAVRYQNNKANATPLWADILSMNIFYKNCPSGMHVDHIIPLQGKTVCGLHTLENLQYLSAHENLAKGNKFINE